MKRQDARKIGVQAQEALRLRVADYLRRKKGTQAEAADIFQLSLRGVQKIWKQYKEGGRKALLAKKRGPAHRISRLRQEQVKEITSAMKKGAPDEYGLAYYLWTAGAVRLLIQKKHMVVDDSFNGVVFIRFLQKLIRSVKQKVFLLADSHPVHLEKKATRWLQEHKTRIELLFLPTYIPELNPDEYFNQDLKTNGVGKTRPTNKQELKELAERFANGKKRNPE